MYTMTCTRPDITFAFFKLNKYIGNPSMKHWLSVRVVPKYLRQVKMIFHLVIISLVVGCSFKEEVLFLGIQ